MTLNIITVGNLIRLLFLSAFFYIVNSTSAQCWNQHTVKSGFKKNTVYSLDSLSVSDKLLCVLDHSINLIDTFNVNKRKTWLYYVICLNSRFDTLGQTHVRIELKQGVDYDIFSFYLPHDGGYFSGAFCYKGYTYFVLCEHENLPIYEELFIPVNKKDFHVYYNSPFKNKMWRRVNYKYLESFAYLFYGYKHGVFTYISTKFVD